MLLSFAIVFLVGMSAAAIFRKLRFPGIIGLLASGIVVGPYVLDLLDPSLLGISMELRQIALIIILIRAGLSLELSDLKKVGRPAVLMSFLPACFEIVGYLCFAPLLLGISHIEAAVMGAVLGAVSPAVTVPRMIRLIEEKRGTKKGIPQMILAGASCDDVFVIVLSSTFVAMAQGSAANAAELAAIPVSIVSGIVLGACAGIALYFVFKLLCGKNRRLRDSYKVLIILSSAFLLTAAEALLKDFLALSGLLAVVAMACALKLRQEGGETERLSNKFGKLWLAAEILLFVLVGAAVDIRYTLEAGLSAVGMIFIALMFRTVGVALCLIGTGLSFGEKLFCVIAYFPKATVQAAIGSVPLSLGLPCGRIVLSVAVLSIIITAPLGALGIDAGCKRLLNDDNVREN